MTTKQNKKLKVTLTSSTFGRKPGHAACVQGLGLNRRIRNSVIVADTAENRGMITKVGYLLQVEEI
ncbi:MAG: 50S ribosomal protein L30 [Gammaproteobacteria bacterium RIFCSPHIGHO2_12_FULL_36_30]|nr:MAG: 50S ribosomal protein L30 [Gammaproteobacteria bacterium RIFCSPHIGHO2_12_FULL_36_30]